MFNYNPTLIPIDSNVKFSEGEGEEDTEVTEYRSLGRRKWYLLQMRPNHVYVVGIRSRYMQNPKKMHVAVIKQILRNVKGTIGFGIRNS